MTQAIISGESKWEKTTKLSGATAATGTASATLVTGAANTLGIIVRSGSIAPNGSGTAGAITVGGNILRRCVGSTNYGYPCVIENYFVPPGLALAVTISGAADYDFLYEVVV